MHVNFSNDFDSALHAQDTHKMADPRNFWKDSIKAGNAIVRPAPEKPRHPIVQFGIDYWLMPPNEAFGQHAL
jgi:hypothetical protein